MPYIGANLFVVPDDPITNITSITNVALKMGRDTDNLIDFATTDDVIILRVAGVNEINVAANVLSPVTSDGAALGTASLMWSDLFAASGSVINFNNGDMTITHSANTLTVAGGTFATAALTASTGVFSGILKTDDTTDATSATDGSLQTDGGLSVAKVGFIGTDLKVGDDVSLTSDFSVFNMGADNDFTITHDGTTGATIAGTPISVNSTGALTLDSSTDITLDADGGDVFFKDAGTTFGSATNTFGNLIIKSGTTTAATFAGANVTFAGTIGSGAITSTGIVTGTGFTAGSAVLAEAELELLDGITAGTAAASKVLVLDANKDIGTIRNLTIDGVFTDGNYTFDTSGNVSGLGTVGSGAITSSGGLTGTQVDILAQGDLRLQDSSGGQHIALEANATTTTYTLTFPAAQGGASTHLQNNGSGALSWATASAGVGLGLVIALS